MTDENKYLVSSSPQIHSKESTMKIMWTVSLCLLPAAIWGVMQFGLRSLFVLSLSIITAVLTEWVINKVQKQNTLGDGSAFLTGLLIGFNMPPAIPGFIPVIASIFAIAVVKHTFGGLGGNWMNPALAGRVFVFFSWTSPMATWKAPSINMGIDSLSGASPLGFVKTNMEAAKGLKGPIDILTSNQYPISQFSSDLANWLKTNLGITIQGNYLDLFFGNISGSIGEISAFLLLVGSIYLFIKKIITWEIPVTYLASFGILVWILGGLSFTDQLFTGDIAFHIFSGGLILGAFYMATDMVTSPLTTKGKIIFGIGTGFLTFLIRFYGSFPEGVSLAIIIMNFLVPSINRLTQPVRFGLKKEGQEI
jgi:electron transport complex protein RnfD